MSRIIKFRGKRLDNGAWETGGVVPVNVGTSAEKWCISCKHTGSVSGDYGHGVLLTEVDPDTVGQFTGLLDKDGKEIYEGDIVRRDNYDNYVVCFGEYDTNGSNTVPSDNFGWYLSGCSRLACPVMDIRSSDGMMLLFPRSCCKEDYATDRFGMNIIGNAHSNPELLKNE